MNLQYGTVTNDLCVTCNSFGNSRDLVLNEPSDPMSPNWELWEPHTCYPSEQVRFFLNYNRITGYLTAILFDDVGNVLVSWETNVVDWNYTDPTQLDQLVHTDVQCTWAFNVTVGL